MLIIATVITLVTTGCKTTDQVIASPEEYTGDKLVFGSGGGFTGQYETYTLLDNGVLFVGNGAAGSGLVRAMPLDKTTTTQMFTNFSSLGLDKMIVRDPGNLSYFVERQVGDTKHRLTWGGNQQKVPEVVEKYYLNLYKLARRQKAMPLTR